MGDAGSDLTEKGALAEPGVAVEDGELAGGDATRPEPAQGFGGDIAEAEGVTAPHPPNPLREIPHLPDPPPRGYPARRVGRGGVSGWGFSGAEGGADEVVGNLEGTLGENGGQGGGRGWRGRRVAVGRG